jgi:hypothetical protein
MCACVCIYAYAHHGQGVRDAEDGEGDAHVRTHTLPRPRCPSRSCRDGWRATFQGRGRCGATHACVHHGRTHATRTTHACTHACVHACMRHARTHACMRACVTHARTRTHKQSVRALPEQARARMRARTSRPHGVRDAEDGEGVAPGGVGHGGGRQAPQRRQNLHHLPPPGGGRGTGWTLRAWLVGPVDLYL